jgi:hypothetical protein
MAMKKLKTTGLLLMILLQMWQLKAQQPAPLLIQQSLTAGKPYQVQTIPSILQPSSRLEGVLYDQGTLVNSPGTGHGGADESIVFPPLTILAYPSGSPMRTADDFTIDDFQWAIDSIAFFDIIPNAPTSPSYFSGYYVRIWDGKPGENGSHVIWGDQSTNRLISSAWDNLYRRGPENQGSTSLAVFRNICGTGGLVLPAGNYWLEAQAYSNETAYTYASPVVSVSPTSGNAIQLNELTNAWEPLINNTYCQGMPFVIFGHQVLKNLDAAITELLTPQSGSGLSASELISIKVRNCGSQPISNIPVSYTLNNGPAVSGLISGPVESESEVNFTFVQPADFSSIGNYELVIDAQLPGDEFAANDQKTFTISNYSSVVNMENGSTASCSGLFFDAGGAGGNYNNSDTLTHAFFPATNAPNAKIEFNFEEFDLEYPYDDLYVYDGPSWQTDPLLRAFSGGMLGEIGTIRSSHPSGALTFRFISDNDNNRPGWKAEFHCFIPEDNDLAAISVTTPAYATQNIPATFHVKVKNTGNLTQGSYQIKLFQTDNTEIGSVNGVPLSYSQEYEFVIQGTFSTSGLKDIYAKVILAGDQQPENDATPTREIEVMEDGTGYVIVGTGNEMGNRLPVSYESMNSLTESIYFPDEIGMEGMIAGIGYIYSFRQNVSDAPLKIWMGECLQSDLTTGWIPASDLTLVFDGTASYQKGIDTVRIDFTNPYEYHGGNLVIMVNRPFDYTIFAGNELGPNLFQSSSTPEHPGRSREYFADLVVIDPARPRFGTLVPEIPNTLLKFDVSMMSHMQGIVYDASNLPIEGAEVTATGSQTSGISNNAGHYAVKYIWPGSQQAKAVKHTFDDEIANLNLVAGDITIHDFQLDSRPLSFISGSVRPADDPSIGLEGALITITGYDTSYTTTSNNAGFFLFTGVYGNTDYQLNISYPEYDIYNSLITMGSNALDLGNVILRELSAHPQNILATDLSSFSEISWESTSLDYTIQYDNDSVYYYLMSFSDARESAIRFTPTSYPCQIKKAILNVHDMAAASGNPAGSFTVKVYDDNGENSLPGTILGEVMATPGMDGWVEVDLTALNISITSGDFYIAHVQVGSYPNYVEIGLDQSVHPENRSYSKPASWSQWALEQYYYHFMIRAMVSGSSASDNLMVLDGNETTSSETVRSMEGYSVYRLRSGEEEQEDLWVSLSENQTSEGYTDNDWNSLPWGEYRYGVKTSYTNGILSTPGFSNVLPKNMNITAFLQLTTNTDYIPADASVTLTNVNGNPDLVYSTNYMPAGSFQFNPFTRGNYRVQVNHHNFLPFDQVLSITSASTVEIMLTEKTLAPVLATASDMDTLALVKWYNPTELRDIIMDDSLADASFCGFAGYPVWFGNRFANSNTADLISFDVFFERHPFASEEVMSIDIFDANHNLLGTSELFVPVCGQWMTVRVPDIPVNGDFYGMIHIDQSMGDSHYLGLDLDGPLSATNPGFVYNGSEWLTVPQYITGLNSGVFMIRPVLNVGSNGADDSNRSTERSVQDYSLFRFEPGEENNQALWIPVSMSVNDTVFPDESWEFVVAGNYRYGVSANYSTGLSSGFTFTNIITRLLTFPAPENLAAIQVGDDETLFSWSTIARPDIEGYEVYLDDMVTPMATISDTSFNFTGLLPDVTYTASVKAVYAGGESILRTIQFTLIPTDINTINMKKPEIFPNPVHDVVFVAEAKGGLIEIYGITGKLMLTKQLDEPVSRLNIDGLSNGVYLVKILLNSDSFMQKLIISR